MAKTKISEFSATPANNTDIDSINIAEGCAPSGINDAIRELMAQLKDFQTGAVGDSFNGPIGTSTAAAGAFTTLAASGSVTLSGGTANGVTYLNGSKVLTSGSALVFDGQYVSLGAGLSSPNGLKFLANGGGLAANLTVNHSTGEIQNFATTNYFPTWYANNSEGMRLTSTGLGIGTSSPAAKLSIYGDSTDTVFAYIENNNAAGSAAGDKRLSLSMGGSSAFGISGWQNAGVVEGTSTGGLWLGAYNGAIKFATGSSARTERARIDSSGNLGVGTTSPNYLIEAKSSTAGIGITGTGTTANNLAVGNTNASNTFYFAQDNSTGTNFNTGVAYGPVLWTNASSMTFVTNSGSNIMKYSGGNLLVGTTSTTRSSNGVRLVPGTDDGTVSITNARSSGGSPIEINRQVSDGTLVAFYQADTLEGTISVSGTTVSYNGGHLSRWAQTTSAKDDSILKGTVLSNLDEMNVYTKDGQPVDNEQLNKVKVSDTEGDVNVAGVFVNWSHDDAHNVDEINMAMTGDMIIRIAQGVTVVRGDLLMSAGDGTAKPQGDDIIRSKTVAKVTSNHVTCTYADGSYCVPCVLMAC